MTLEEKISLLTKEDKQWLIRQYIIAGASYSTEVKILKESIVTPLKFEGTGDYSRLRKCECSFVDYCDECEEKD